MYAPVHELTFTEPHKVREGQCECAFLLSFFVQQNVWVFTNLSSSTKPRYRSAFNLQDCTKKLARSLLKAQCCDAHEVQRHQETNAYTVSSSWREAICNNFVQVLSFRWRSQSHLCQTIAVSRLKVPKETIVICDPQDNFKLKLGKRANEYNELVFLDIQDAIKHQ